MKTPRAVLLDMDGLLLDTERISREVFRAAAAAFGLTLSDAAYAALIGRRSDDAPGILRAVWGADAPVEALLRDADRRYGRRIDTGPIPLRPGVGALLDFLDEAGWLRAVATSTRTERARFKLEKAGILARVGRVSGGETAARGKPFPDLYLKAAEPFGLPPGEVVVLEDSLPGVRGAAAAGMRAVMIPDLQAPDDKARALAAAVFPDLGAFARAAREGRI